AFLDEREIVAIGVFLTLEDNGLLIRQLADDGAELDAECFGRCKTTTAENNLIGRRLVRYRTDQARHDLTAFAHGHDHLLDSRALISSIETVGDGRWRDRIGIKLDDVLAILEDLVENLSPLLDLPHAGSDLQEMR